MVKRRKKQITDRYEIWCYFVGYDKAILNLAWEFKLEPNIVEVLSQTAQDIPRDRQVKLKLYSRVGVREYWIVDWQQQTVEIYRRSQARLEHLFTLFPEDELTSPLFPEFSLQVAEIFA